METEKQTTNDMRNRASRFLRAAARIVMRSYAQYLRSGDEETSENKIKKAAEFKAFHDAGKSAASHLEVLMKLERNNQDNSEEEQGKDEILRQKLFSAEEEIKTHENRDPEN